MKLNPDKTPAVIKDGLKGCLIIYTDGTREFFPVEPEKEPTSAS